MVRQIIISTILLSFVAAYGDGFFFASNPHKGKSVSHTTKGVANGNILWRLLGAGHFTSDVLSIIHHQKHTVHLLNDVKTGMTCDLCRFGVSLVREMVKKDKSEKDIEWTAKTICTEFEIEEEPVCQGITKMFVPEVAAVLRNTTLDTHEICGFLLEQCFQLDDPKFMWNIQLPNVPKPPVKPIPQPKSGAAIYRVLHLTDIHFDPSYTIGADADCDEPLCCRKKIPGSKGAKAGKWGTPSKCDTPLWTLENLLYHLSTKDKFDYILWTGDLPPHDVWNQTRKTQLKIIMTVTEMMLKYFPNTPIYPALGNHEGVPVDSFPPNFVKGNLSMSWLYERLAQNWKHWLPSQENVQTIKKGAFYSTLVKPGFRIISINTNFCNDLNWWLMLNMVDPNGELKWLINELQNAENSGEKVHIIGHIPPGLTDCLKGWSWNYYKIINRYESTVRSQFFGHTHKDEFEVFYDESSGFTRATSVAYIAPSVTTFADMHPGYRVYSVDASARNGSWTVLDHETYIMNVTKANLVNHPTWEREYSAKNAYNMVNLLPEQWDGVIQRLEDNDMLFETFYKLYFKSFPQAEACDQACKETMLCNLRSGRSYDPQICQHLQTEFHKMAEYRRKKRSC